MKNTMNCDDVRPEILDYQRGRLSTRVHEDVRAHLDECPTCRHDVVAEAQSTDVLEHRLRPQMAPPALKRRLAAQ